jgi:hypothetical protein
MGLMNCLLRLALNLNLPNLCLARDQYFRSGLLLLSQPSHVTKDQPSSLTPQAVIYSNNISDILYEPSYVYIYIIYISMY